MKYKIKKWLWEKIIRKVFAQQITEFVISEGTNWFH